MKPQIGRAVQRHKFEWQKCVVCVDGEVLVEQDWWRCVVCNGRGIVYGPSETMVALVALKKRLGTVV